MINWLQKNREDLSYFDDYQNCIGDLLQNEKVRLLQNYVQHGNATRLEHCLFVSYKSYLICKKLGYDYRSAARGGLLHDFYLYDRRVEKPYKGFHGLVHPQIALENATKHFDLNEKEKDIIYKHMWPLTMRFPKYKETFIVSCVDKYCASVEFVNLRFLNHSYLLREIADL
mgnify:CR=1 FL=1